MSFQALAWATKLRLGKAGDKLILVAFADRHNEESGCAYPSIAWLTEFSSLNRKTVIAAVERLVDAGLLEDSGERKGSTKQIKVYRVHVGRVPETGQSQKRNSSEIPSKESQKRDTEPVREPTISEAKASSMVQAENDNHQSFALIGDPRSAQAARSKGRSKRESFAPANWHPKPHHAQRANTSGLDLALQAELFRNHEFKDGKSDFDRAFTTWLINAAGRFANRSTPRGVRDAWDPMQQAIDGLDFDRDDAA